MTKDEREKVEIEWKKWGGVCKRRQKIVVEMWKLIEECLPDAGNKMEVRESLGLDE